MCSLVINSEVTKIDRFRPVDLAWTQCNQFCLFMVNNFSTFQGKR